MVQQTRERLGWTRKTSSGFEPSQQQDVVAMATADTGSGGAPEAPKSNDATAGRAPQDLCPSGRPTSQGAGCSGVANAHLNGEGTMGPPWPMFACSCEG
jgi:hypothetical protein